MCALLKTKMVNKSRDVLHAHRRYTGFGAGGSVMRHITLHALYAPASQKCSSIHLVYHKSAFRHRRRSFICRFNASTYYEELVKSSVSVYIYCQNWRSLNRGEKRGVREKNAKSALLFAHFAVYLFSYRGIGFIFSLLL